MPAACHSARRFGADTDERAKPQRFVPCALVSEQQPPRARSDARLEPGASVLPV
jgi:hypothetical protein